MHCQDPLNKIKEVQNKTNKKTCVFPLKPLKEMWVGTFVFLYLTIFVLIKEVDLG